MSSLAPKIGVALYIKGHPFDKEGNWACEFRKEPFQFVSASDLPSQTLWITNADLGDLMRAGLHKNPKIAHEGYFRTRISQMIQELGIGEWSLDQQASMLAEMLGCAAEMARLQLGLTQYPSNGIAQAVGQLYGVQEPAEGSTIYQIAERACQNYTSCERERRYEQAKIFSFWLPRYDWSSKLLREPLPTSESLKGVSPHALPNMGRDVAAVVKWATESKLPLFARIRIHGLEEVVGKLMNYGAGAQNVTSSTADGAIYDARNMREWCSLPELDVLSQAGDIEILQVAIAGGWTRSGLDVFKSKPCAVSYSYSLVAENLWVGLTRKPSPDGKTSKNLTTAWLQALDRMHCLRIAEKLHSTGMEIINYGYGRITVVCPKSVIQIVPQIAREMGLMYPSSLQGLEPYTPNSAHAFMVMQSLLCGGDHNNLRRMNQLALRELEGARRGA